MARRIDEPTRGFRPEAAASARGWWARVAGGGLLAILAACATPPGEREHPGDGARSIASRAIVAKSDALRALTTFEASGVCRIEIPREDSGFDEEQLDLLLVLERPLRTALRLKLSVSDTLAWLGSDGEQWWLFLPEESPSLAYRGRVGSEPAPAMDDLAVDQSPIPRSLRDPRLFWLLIGLEPPRDPGAVPSWDSTRGAWVLEERIEAAGGDGEPPTIRRGFDAAGDPVFVEVVDALGARLAGSVLQDHASVEVEGLPLGGWPRVATRITVEGDRASDGRAMLVLERPSGRGSRVKSALFDWQRLAASMRPERILEVAP
ncbi:MAG: hypothetical protein ACO38W_07665 [Phycisphaerales bacterium]